MYQRRPRRTKNGRVGIVIALATDDSSDSRRIRNDFVRIFRRLVTEGTAGGTFDVIDLPDHVAITVENPESASRIQRRTQSRLVLYGTVMTGQLNGSPAHSVALSGLISHAPIPEEARARFGNEFGEVLPRKVLIGMSNDLVGLDFLSSWAHVVAKYIVGMAAAFSGDFNFAAAVFDGLQKQLRPSPAEPPAVARIRGQLPRRLAEVNTLRASRAHRRWLVTKSEQDLAQVGRYSDAVPDQLVKQIGAANLKAIWLFLSQRDARAALRLIEQNRIEGDLAWLVNRAFLHAYLGNLGRANVFYRKAEGYEPDPDVLRQVDEFLEAIS
jgi:hypothetical protein